MENLPTGAHRSLIVLLLFLALLGGLSGARSNTRVHVSSKEIGLARTEHPGILERQYPTGSTLPDCSHACGPCVPCKRVMVSYRCATESCPMVYRCMCRGKYYHVPSH